MLLGWVNLLLLGSFVAAAGSVLSTAPVASRNTLAVIENDGSVLLEEGEWIELDRRWPGRAWRDVVRGIGANGRSAVLRRALFKVYLHGWVEYASKIGKEDASTWSEASKVLELVVSQPAVSFGLANRDLLDGTWASIVLMNMGRGEVRRRERNADLEVWQKLRFATNSRNWAVCGGEEFDGDACECGFIVCSPEGRVVGADFGGVGLSGTLPSEVGRWSELRALRLWENPAISYGAVNFDKFTSLQLLSISHPVKTTPHSPLCMGLQALEVKVPTDRVQEEELEWVCDYWVLRRLTIRGGVSKLPECIGQANQELLELDIRGNAIDLSSPVSFPSTLSSLRFLRIFRASHQVPHPNNKTSVSQRTSLVEFWNPSAPWWSWSALELFEATNSGISGPFRCDLIGMFWPRITSLQLAYNPLLNGSISLQGCIRGRTLTELNLEHCAITSISPTSQLVPKVFPSLSFLGLANNPIETQTCIATKPFDNSAPPLITTQNTSIQLAYQCPLGGEEGKTTL